MKSTSPILQALDAGEQASIVGGTISLRSDRDGHYVGTADLDKAIQVTSGTTRESLNTLAVSATERSAVPIEASVDDQGRLTELSYTIRATRSSTSVVIKFRNFGQPVNVTRPPADEVIEAPKPIYDVL